MQRMSKSLAGNLKALTINRRPSLKPQIALAFGPQGSNGHDVLRTLGRLRDRPTDEMIGEFFGPARLVSGPGLAVVAATAPSNPRG